MHRRNFLRQSSMGLAAFSLMPLSLNAFDHVVAELNAYQATNPDLPRVEDEAYWSIGPHQRHKFVFHASGAGTGH